MHPYPMASVFTEGMRRDVDRAMLPGGSVWNLVDFVPDELGAAASGRGGWTYASSTLSGATILNACSYAPFSSGSQVVTVDNTSKLWNALAGTSPGSITSGPGCPPFFHRNYLIIPCFTGGNISKYDGTTISALTTTYPHGVCGGVYKDHSILANDGTNKNRVWFSAAGDPTTWDLNFGWWDTTGDVVAIGTLLNAVLIFHHDSTERLRGTTPPPGSDMTLEPFLNVGCINPFSLAYWQQRLIFASAQGIYMTDGVTSVDLTAVAQMKTYWQSLLSGFNGSTWRIAAGVYRDHYIISINNGTTLVDCLCVSLQNQTMWRLSNLHGAGFASVTDSIQEKLYMAPFNANRVIELSSMWSPSASVKQDGDGTNPTPIVETGGYRGWDRLHRRWIESMGIQTWRYAFLDYDLRDAAADNPTMTLSFATTPGGGYSAMTGGNITKTTDYSRSRRTIHPATTGGGTRSNMMEFKLAINGPYASAKVYALEADFAPIDIGRLK